MQQHNAIHSVALCCQLARQSKVGLGLWLLLFAFLAISLCTDHTCITVYYGMTQVKLLYAELPSA